MFCKKCGAWYGQLGLEPTPELYVEHLIQIFREIKRVLKPHGNLFVVIDDTYAGSGGWNSGGGLVHKEGEWLRRHVLNATSKCPTAYIKHIPRKSLCLVPELFAIRMVYGEGWILRQKIIWPKKVLIYKDMETIGNAMPESVKDRMTHTWEYIYHFVKEPKYYYDQLRIPYKESTIVQNQYRDRSKHNPYAIKALLQAKSNNSIQLTLDNNIAEENNHNQRKYENTSDFTFADNLAEIREAMREQGLPECHPLGANAPDVIQINTEPFPEAHFAVYPTKLVELLIKVGCPEQVCKKCGKPREKIIKKITINVQDKRPDRGQISNYPQRQRGGDSIVYTVGWTDCGCGKGFEPGIVLDPFLGSGTTALVALQMGRRFIGIELNKEYCEMALRRIKPYLNQQTLPID